MHTPIASSRHAVSVIWAWAALSTGCTQGGQSGDLNEDALGRNNGEERDDAGAAPSDDDDSAATERDAATPIPPDEEPEPTPGQPEPTPDPEPTAAQPEPAPGAEPEPNPSQPDPAPGPEPEPAVQPNPAPTAISPDPTPDPAGAPTPSGMEDACTIVTYDENVVDPVALGFDGVNVIEFYGDGGTTVCASPTTGRLCVSGIAPDSGEDYARWGAGVAFVVEPNEGSALDVSSLDVTAIGFELSEVHGRAVRVGLQQVDDPEIADPALNFGQNSFYWGGSNTMAMTEDATVTIAFSQFSLPSWTRVVDPETGENGGGMLIDASQLSSLHFEISNTPTDATEPYGFCVSEVAWKRADGSTVDVPVPVPLDAGTSE